MIFFDREGERKARASPLDPIFKKERGEESRDDRPDYPEADAVVSEVWWAAVPLGRAQGLRELEPGSAADNAAAAIASCNRDSVV